MPELPDVTIYLEAHARRSQGRVLERIRVAGPSLQELEATHSP